MYKFSITSLYSKKILLKILSLEAMLLLATISIAFFVDIESTTANAFTEDWIPMYSDRAYAPVVAVNDNIYVTWWSNSSTGEWDVFFARSTDNGRTFDDVIKLTDGNGSSFDTRIAASGDNVYVTWLNNKTGVNQIYFTASNDTGLTFGNEVMINNKSSGIGAIAEPTPRINHGTALVSSGENVYMTWFEDIDLTPPAEVFVFEDVDGDVTLQQPEIFFKASNDGGKTFGDVINLSNSTNGRSDDPAIAEEGNDVFITFWDDKTGQRSPYFTASYDGGKTFSNLIILNATAQ
jgi:hypothetical protein